jgi:hypothetical protein
VPGDLLLDLPQAPGVRRGTRERERVPVGGQGEVAQAPLERLAADRTALEVLIEPVGQPPFEQRVLARRVFAEDPLAFAAIQR